MWHTFNLIREGDQVTATTYRKISKDTGVGADSERIKLKLTVIVEVVEFDAEGKAIID
jgi:protein pelota